MHLLWKHPELWGFKQKSWTSCVLPTSAVEQTRGCSVYTGQCNGYRPGSEDIPTHLLETRGKKVFFLVSFSIGFPTTFQEQSMERCVAAWIPGYLSPLLCSFCLSPPEDSSLENLPWKQIICLQSWEQVSKTIFPCQRSFLMPPWQKKKKGEVSLGIAKI